MEGAEVALEIHLDALPPPVQELGGETLREGIGSLQLGIEVG